MAAAFSFLIWNCCPVNTLAAQGVLVADQDVPIEVKVYRLILDPTSNQPLVILADRQEESGIPIVIGFFEANAIGAEIEGITHKRPLTHDLLSSILSKAKLRIDRIVVTHLTEGTYYATILLEMEKTLVKIDARPSDSIVLALKHGAPIFVSKALFEERAVALKASSPRDEDYGIRLQELTSSLAEAFSYRSTKGTLVADVRSGSSAERDGMERGDIIVEIEGQPTDSVLSVRTALEKYEAPLRAKVFRKQTFVELKLNPE
jgi:bifunctional DNase/RNase